MARAGYSEQDVFAQADRAMCEGGVAYFGPDAVLIAFDEGDCWFLWLYAGEDGIARAFSLAPYSRPFVSWVQQRRGREERVRFPWERIKRLSACLSPA